MPDCDLFLNDHSCLFSLGPKGCFIRAARMGNVERISRLIQTYNFDPTVYKFALYVALKFRQHECVRLLSRDVSFLLHPHMETPLIIATCNDDAESVSILLHF
jgi:hypothetical protein